MIIYVDNEYKCHITDDGTMIAVETDFFDGKCDAFIEGFRFVPKDASWERSDGEIFHGEMIAPFIDSKILVAYQEQYEVMQAELNKAYQEGVNSI